MQEKKKKPGRFKGQMEAIHAKMPEPKPRLNLNSKKLPAIKNWDVGETYTVTAKIKMREKRQGELYTTGEPDNETVRAEFEIESVEAKKDEDGE